MKCEEILQELASMRNPEVVVGMARFGIETQQAFGVSIPVLRRIAKRCGSNLSLAEELWASGYHEARILATMVAPPSSITEALMDRWARKFNSWDLCDQCCNNLFRKTAFAHRKARQWSRRDEEFVKRAGFVLMAVLAVHDKEASDEIFRDYLRLVERESGDQRNFVKKAVNWALRQIGKRNLDLNRFALETARRILATNPKAGRWVATNAIRELEGTAVQARLNG